jgi:sugar lactone lactonase YvrE
MSFFVIGFTSAETYWVCSHLSPANHFTAIEGTACDKYGNIYAVSFGGASGIGKVTPEGLDSLFITLPDSGCGNGIRFASDGSMLIADYKGHRIFKVDMQTRAISVLAHQPLWRQPNDIAITSGNVLFASDPIWSPDRKWGHIWRIDPDGTTTLVAGDADSLYLVNGIEVAPGDSILYVSNAQPSGGLRRIMAYTILPDGSLANQRVHCYLNGTTQTSDGMRCDMEGNHYITRGGLNKIDIVSPQGVLVDSVRTIVDGVLFKASNLDFGGPDGKTCYLANTTNKRISVFRNNIPGRSWKMFQDWQVSVKENDRSPGIIIMAGNSPNPFNPATTIRVSLSAASSVELAIYNLAGQKIAVLADGHLNAGEYSYRWDAAGHTSGVYIWKLRAGNEIRTGKMLLMK